MKFLLIVIVALVVLGIVAALLSMGDNDSPIVTADNDCATCHSNDGSCKIACLKDEIARRQQEKEAATDNKTNDFEV